MAMSTPTTIQLKALLATHPDYSPHVGVPSGGMRPLLDKYQDIYEGGERFERHKKHYLRPRQRDADPGFFAARLASAHYTGQAGSLVDWLSSKVFADTPRVVSTDPYYDGLNSNSDGSGRDFAAIAQDAALESMIYRRAYLGVDFPGTPAVSLYDAKVQNTGRAALDAYLRLYGARDVDDWGEDDSGNLEWARIHTVRCVRSGYEQTGDDLEHTWTYVDGESKSTFRVTLKRNEEPENRAIEAVDYESVPGLPLFRVEIPTGFWVMHGLASTQLAIFNADAGLAFLYDTNCYQMPIIKSAKQMSSLVVGEMSALKLDPGEDASFLSPSGTPFEQLRQWVDKLESRLYLRVQAMGLQAASKDEHGRQSGVAKQRDMDAAHALLAAYRGRLKDVFEAALLYIQTIRQDDKRYKIEGFDASQEVNMQQDPGNPEGVENA